MANYSLYGNSAPLLDLFENFILADALLYATDTEFGVVHSDGSKSFFSGTGFVWNAATGRFDAGTATAVAHYQNGLFVDDINNMSLNLSEFSSAAQLYLTVELYGDDIIDARYRVDGLVLPANLRGYFGNDTIYGGRGSDTLMGDWGNDNLIGGGGNDTLDGGLDNDTLTGGLGNDRFFGREGADVMNGGGGNDVYFGGSGNDISNGGAGNDRILDWEGDDVLRGGANSDVLYGGTGNDSLFGGTGTDTAVFDYDFSSLSITKTSSGFTVTSNNGTDTLTSIERIAADDGTYSYNSSTKTWTKLNSISGLELALKGDATIGTTGNDTFSIGQEETPVYVNGLDGNDTLSVFSFVSTQSNGGLVKGGAGDDTITVRGSATSLFRVFGESGNDTINLNTTNSLSFADGGIGDDVLSGGGTLIGGAGNDRLTGTGTLRGGDGDDVLTGGATVTGGSGGDTFVTLINGGAGFGSRTITDFKVGVDKLTVTFTNIAQTPVYTLTSTAAGMVLTAQVGGTAVAGQILFAGITSELTVDMLFPDTGPRTLVGGTGNDSLVGGSGNDLLWGDVGDDTLVGNGGIDTAGYFGSFASLTVTAVSGGFTVSSLYGGNDTLSGIERIAANDGTYEFSNGSWTKVNSTTGVALFATPSQIYTGTAGDDTASFISFAGGAPRIVNGLDGNDTFWFQDPSIGQVLATGGNGNDTFKTSANSSTQSYVTGTSALDIDGGAGNDSIEGGNGVDMLKGGDGADTIKGNGGNDILTGGAGADTYDFGLRSYNFRTDTFVYGWDNDTITDFVVGEDHLNFGATAATVEDTAAGLLVSVTYVSRFGGPSPLPTATATVLLDGVHGAYTLADFII